MVHTVHPSYPISASERRLCVGYHKIKIAMALLICRRMNVLTFAPVIIPLCNQLKITKLSFPRQCK